MNGEIKPVWLPDQGTLIFDCMPSAFDNLAQELLEKVDIPDQYQFDQSKLKYINIRSNQSQDPIQSRWQDRVALLGCAMIGFVLMFVFVAGIQQITGWFR